MTKETPEQLEARMRKLQQQLAQVKKERDAYKRELEKLPIKGPELIRAEFRQACRDMITAFRTLEMRLPSLADTQVFEAEQWRRLDEAIQATHVLRNELDKLLATRAVSASSEVEEA